VIPASVSTVTTMSLWLGSGFKAGGVQTRTRVIFIFGIPAARACGAAAIPAADVAASDLTNDLRFIFQAPIS
jgi:hypothetical protein